MKPIKTRNYKERGMTLIEVLFSVAIMTAFLAVFLATTEFTSKFMKSSENSDISSQGLLIDHHYLYMAMDDIAEILSQPAYTKQEIFNLSKKCVRDPNTEWEIPGPKMKVVNGYRICLKQSSIQEPDDIYNSDKTLKSSSLNQLINGAKPGIYILQAIPDEISAASLPVRRIFCRPKPFCG